MGKGGLNKQTMPSISTPFWEKAVPPAFALKLDTQFPLPHHQTFLMSSEMLLQYWSAEQVSQSDSFKRSYWDSRSPLSHSGMISIGFHRRKDFSFQQWCFRLESSVWIWGTSTAEISLYILNTYTWMWNQHVLHLYHSSQSWYSICIPLIIRLLLSYTSGNSHCWLLCRLILISMWLWEEVSTAFSCFGILTRTAIF